jgi:hypothetical protein
MIQRILAALAVLGFGLAAAPAALAQNASQPCVAAAVAQSTKQVAPGVTLTWDDSFVCAEPGARGSYTFTATITNSAASTAAASLNELVLSHTTPRRGPPPPLGPANPAFQTTGLPATLQPGQSAQISVTGDYQTVRDDDRDVNKLTLHFRLNGAVADGAAFRLGLNVHLTPLGADDGPGEEDEGPPPAVCGRQGAPGPPAWVCNRRTGSP